MSRPTGGLLRSHNDRGTDLRASSATAVPNARIEVDRVAGIEGVGVGADDKVDLAADHVEELRVADYMTIKRSPVGKRGRVLHSIW